MGASSELLAAMGSAVREDAVMFRFCPTSFLLRKPGFRVTLTRAFLMWSFECWPAAMLLIRPFMAQTSR